MMSRNFIPEQDLINKLPFGDSSALEELSRRYGYALYSYCIAKLKSPEDARRIVRNLFISIWENRDRLPKDFSLSVHLYTEVRKAVVQCINSKLKTSSSIPSIEEQIIPEFSIKELQKARQRVKTSTEQKSRYHMYENQWWNKFFVPINLKNVKHSLKSMRNMW